MALLCQQPLMGANIHANACEPLLCLSLGMSISSCGVEACSKQVGKSWGQYSYLVEVIILPMLSTFIQHVLQVPCQHFRTCLCFKRIEFYFLQSAATTTEKHGLPMFASPWLSSRHQNTEGHISARKTKAHAEKQPFPDDTGYLEAGRCASWAGGHVGSLQAGCGWLGRDSLAAAALPLLAWVTVWQGAPVQAAEQQSVPFPSPPAQSNLISSHLRLAFPPFTLFVHASACTPFPAVVAFVRHQCLLHLAPVSMLLLMAVGNQERVY